MTPSIEYKFYKLQMSEDGRSYKTIARINSSVGYGRAIEIADELTGNQFSKYNGGFYKMSETVCSIEIYE
jgi:hypothetical protein